MNRIFKTAVTVIGAFAVLTLSSGCSSVSTAPDQVSLHYKAGPISSTKFANCVTPSSRNFDGPADKHFNYPAGQRTYKFTGGDGADSNPFKANTQDNVEMQVSGVATFELDVNCKVLRDLHEKIGIKYQPIMDGDSTAKGWEHLIDVYVGQPLQRAMTEATQTYGWKELYNDPTTKAKWEAKVKTLAPVYVKQLAGEDFFINFNFTIQKPEPPANLVESLNNKQKAIQDKSAQDTQNFTNQSQYKTYADCVRETHFTAAECITIILGKDGKIPYLGSNGGVIVNPPTTK